MGGSEGALPRPPLPFPSAADLLAGALYLLIGKCNHFVLAFRTPNLVSPNALIYAFLMISERPKRDRKPKIIWEAAESLSTASRPKTVVRTVKSDALIPVTVEPLPRPSKLDEPLLIYTPPFQIKKKRGKLSFKGLSAIKIF
jgi:hypothetical protein